MGTDSNLTSLAPLGAASSSEIHTTLSIVGSPKVNNMKIAQLTPAIVPHNCSVTPAVMVQSPNPRTQSSKEDVAMMIQEKSTLHTNAYSRVGIIKPGTYSRSLLRSAPRPKGQGLGCEGCTAVHSLGIDHCHKHHNDTNGKGPHKRLRR
jgi:hypothetical protein